VAGQFATVGVLMVFARYDSLGPIRVVTGAGYRSGNVFGRYSVRTWDGHRLFYNE
jgi:hypothetical protein